MNKKYQVIYADPPWDYGGQKKFLGSKEGSSALDHYPTMTLGAMIDEFTPKVKEWADDDCLLYMWTSSPHLDQAMQLGEAWGFDYKTVAFVWHKQNKLPGFYTMSSVELCLVFKRRGGKIPRGCDASRKEEQFISEKAREHSRKPKEIRRRIERIHGKNINRLEMFARTAPKGWDVFGNQTEKFSEETCNDANELKLNL